MRKRLVIAAALAILLIGIAYVKALFSHQDGERALSPDQLSDAAENNLRRGSIRSGI